MAVGQHLQRLVPPGHRLLRYGTNGTAQTAYPVRALPLTQRGGDVGDVGDELLAQRLHTLTVECMLSPGGLF